MNPKLFARIGAVAFVAVAITMTALQLREEPVREVPEVIDVTDPDSDPLPAQLRLCKAMGEAASRDPVCHAAWEEKRRRFLGKSGRTESAPQPSDESSAVPSEAASHAALQGEQ